MDPSAHAAERPELSLLLVLKDPPEAGLRARLAALAAAMPEAEIRIYGHGDPDRMAPAMRTLAASTPSAWFELATCRRPPGTALAEATGSCAAPWVLWLPEQAQADEVAEAGRIWRHRRAGAFSGVPLRGPCLFERQALLVLPRVPGMPSVLPELYARYHAGAAGSRPSELAARFRRAYVALACRMGLGRTSSPPRA